MARILIILVAGSLVLNALIFLSVATPSSSGEAPAETVAAPPPEPAVRRADVEALSRDVRLLQQELRSINIKLGNVEKQLRAVAREETATPRRLIAPRPATSPAEEEEILPEDGDGGEVVPPINTGDRQFEYSEVPAAGDGSGTPEDPGAAAGSAEEP